MELPAVLAVVLIVAGVWSLVVWPQFLRRVMIDLVGYPPTAAETRAFAADPKSSKRMDKIDELLAQYAEHWDLERMSVVDRNILRMAAYELLWQPEVPPKAAINEALEIAKKFGTTESSRFINGVLDAVRLVKRLGIRKDAAAP